MRRPHTCLAEALEHVKCFSDLPVVGVCAEQVAHAFAAVWALPCFASQPSQHAVFAACRRWTLAAAESPLALRPLAVGETRSFTAAQCRGILASAILGNVADVTRALKTNAGGLNFTQHLLGHAPVCMHKHAALLLYLCKGMELEGTEDDGRVITFERVACPPAHEMQDRLRSATDVPLFPTESTLILQSGTMEAACAHDAQCTGFVNFANAEFGYGCFIPSATQEEILQMCCPEFNIGMALIGRMNDNEVVNVYGCRRFTSYSGYLETFCCDGLLPAATPPMVHDILTLDACTQKHFSSDSQLRDLCKAYSSFAALVARHAAQSDVPSTAVISTGRWGSGAFGGLAAHKLVLKCIAARLAGVHLRFSTMGTPEGCDSVRDAMLQNDASVADAWALLQQCQRRETFVQAFCSGLILSSEASRITRQAPGIDPGAKRAASASVV